jgi:hypothetical protein
LGDFLALRPPEPVPALDALAADCVKDLDALRRPMTPEELVRRESSGLTPRQRGLLHTWGYPYVFEQFRFHLSLTGRLEPERLESLTSVLASRWSPLTSRPVPVTGLCIFHQPARTEPFRLRWRVRWGGEVETLVGVGH